jgi:hypothetical protein
MNHKILHRTIRQFQQAFKVDFNQLTDQDIQTILHGPSETLLAVFQKRYGYTPAQAIHAWNEFVLRRVDGAPSRTAANPVTLMA